LDEFDPPNDEPDEVIDPRVEEAAPKILSLLQQVRVATDRELKVRLEREFFPWVVGRALGSLVDDEKVSKVGYPGRRAIRRSEVEAFYTLAGVDYESIRELVKIKKEVSEGIVNVLTGVSPAGDHAEDLFEDAFSKLNFKLRARNVSEYSGRRAVSVPGKEPPNLDFLLERDGVVYGVDVKNWIRYEWDYRELVLGKVRVAKQLGVVPFMLVRYADEDILYNEVIQRGGLAYRYGDLLLPSVYSSLADSAKTVLGYPVLAVESLPDYKVQWMEKLHLRHIERMGV
jgi:hypothetical protein